MDLDFSMKIKYMWSMAYTHPFKEVVQLGFNTAKYLMLSALMSQSLPVYKNELTCSLLAFCIEIANKIDLR